MPTEKMITKKLTQTEAKRLKLKCTKEEGDQKRALIEVQSGGGQ